ncbi:hypothetical protein [Methylobacterium goesingense]|uniref:Uncharacterized protein n=1 Tax=Methylobacterium goesingense TaxID=243690 RepID=A0ABV2L681_9HYPH|nr:hypothetical protein [Methylobacterium goesingense]GJD73124.1 hypothetical protein CFIICLFH_1349 [Methylobacterium goesingense]
MNIPSAPIRGVTTILLQDGSEITLDAIETSAHGQAILAEIDEAILAIEGQFAFGRETDDPSWRTRAEIALKRKRRSRPLLQERIGVLRRAERSLALGASQAAVSSKVDAKRQAFVHAAYELLGHEACTEVWARAQQKQPGLFADGRGPDA